MNSYNGFTPNQRNRAQAWLNARWKEGSLQRPHTCVACGQSEGILDAHAEDYSEPFAPGKTDQYHLCFCCHMMVHCRHKNPQAWEKYKADIMAGNRHVPFHKRAWDMFKAEMLDNTVPARMERTEPRDYNILERIEEHSKDFR